MKTDTAIFLEEHQWREALLCSEDVDLLRSLDFDVLPSRAVREMAAQEPATLAYVVNPHQYVGHFLLPSGTKVVIKPKIDTANIFRMLAYIYERERPDPFREAEVSYASDKLLFEPLVDCRGEFVSR